MKACLQPDEVAACWLALTRVRWVHRVPAIPHRKSAIVPRPSKILLRNATSTLSINKSSASVRRLRSKSRPFVIAPELAIPIICCDRFLRVVSSRLLLSFCPAPVASFSVENDPWGAIVHTLPPTALPRCDESAAPPRLPDRSHDPSDGKGEQGTDRRSLQQSIR